MQQLQIQLHSFGDRVYHHIRTDFYKPEYMLTSLNRTNAQGNWKFINYDIASPDAPTYNSLDIILKKMNGVTSSCARLNNPVDSILYFKNPSPPVIVDRDFYVKNDGNASLTISAVNFSGTYASMFSLISSLPGILHRMIVYFSG